MTTLLENPTVPAARVVARRRAVSTSWTGMAQVGVAGLAAILYVVNLTVSGFANTYYSAAALAASQSWSAWFFGSIDSSNFITVDKPPLSTMAMGLSVRLFGLSSWSVLLPEALMGVATVVIVMAIVRRTMGSPAAVVAGLVTRVDPGRGPDLPLQQPRRSPDPPPGRRRLRRHPVAGAGPIALGHPRRRPRRPGLQHEVPPGLARPSGVRRRLDDRRAGLAGPSSARSARGVRDGRDLERLVDRRDGAAPDVGPPVRRRLDERHGSRPRPRLRRARADLRRWRWARWRWRRRWLLGRARSAPPVQRPAGRPGRVAASARLPRPGDRAVGPAIRAPDGPASRGLPDVGPLAPRPRRRLQLHVRDHPLLLRRCHGTRDRGAGRWRPRGAVADAAGRSAPAVRGDRAGGRVDRVCGRGLDAARPDAGLRARASRSA